MQFKHLLFVPFALCSSAAMAQGTLTGANFNPVPGDVITDHMLNSVPMPGASGANATWDFSALTDTSTATTTYEACGTSISCGSFAGSNLVGNAGSGNYAFFITDANRWSLNGAYATNSGTAIPYSDPEDVVRYPMTYQTNFTDAFAANFTGGGVQFARSGNVTVTADGYGTLKTPAGTYNNALRLHIVEDYSDASSIVTLTYNNDEYVWVQPNTHAQLFYIINEVIDFGGTTQTVSSARYTVPSSTAVANVSLAESSLKVYPNPATTAVNVDFTTDAKADMAVTLMDVTGRTVATLAKGTTEAGQQHYSYPTAGLPRGVYYLRLQSGTTNTTRKVEVL